MMQYVISFLVYTFAMAGVLIIAFVVYRKTTMITGQNKNSMLKIQDMMRLPDRKILYVINCANEQFLIASSNDRVTLISKLEAFKKRKVNDERIEKYLSEKEVSRLQDSMETDNGYYGDRELEDKKHLIKSLLKELSDKNQAKRGNF